MFYSRIDILKHSLSQSLKKRIYQLYNRVTHNPKKSSNMFFFHTYGVFQYFVKTSYKSHKLNDSPRVFSKLKPENETINKANVMYRIKCNDCEGTHIGQTNQHLHRYQKNSIKNNKPEVCALDKHALDTSHMFDFNAVEALLAREADYSIKSLLEILPVKNDKNSISNRGNI